ncbi:MAG: gene transfer agent family protein [Alphaproteobacteria bacterium]|nr:gene transfer agent family protein [Alphaproteobacteria bacterium]
MNGIELTYAERCFVVHPDMRLVAEIEEELGGMPALKQKFATGRWTVTELVALVQMFLQQAGRPVDFIELGDRMLKDGLLRYVRTVQNFLQEAVSDRP